MRRISDLVRHHKPVTLPPRASVQDACALMRDRRLGCVLVLEGEKLVGIFTARDAVHRVLANAMDVRTTALAQVMTHDPQTLGAKCTAIEALRLMQNCGFRHIPVVEGGRVLGVVAKGDFSGLELARLEEETSLWEMLG